MPNEPNPRASDIWQQVDIRFELPIIRCGV
jgi:hypothetical protein